MILEHTITVHLKLVNLRSAPVYYNMKKNLKNDLAGWTEIIRKQGEDMRKREEERRCTSRLYIESVKDKDMKERLRALMEAHYSGLVSLTELFSEIRSMVGMENEDENEYIPGMDDGIDNGG
jgi:hypothetical protein